MADDGRRWQTMADDCRRLQTIADKGSRFVCSKHEPPHHQNNTIHPNSARDDSTSMNPIRAAIEDKKYLSLLCQQTRMQSRYAAAQTRRESF
jgi:hypothetical protein